MAKPNYAFEKRQRELAKKRKKEEKAARKSSPGPEATEEGQAPETEGTPAPPPVPQGEPGTP